jgi:hypothetical protein
MGEYRISDKIIRYVAVSLIAIVAAMSFALWYGKRAHDSTVRDLQNEIAKRDETVEYQKDVYGKLTIQMKDLNGAIDKSTEEGKRLAAEIKRNGEQIASVTGAVMKLKEQVAKGQGTQTQPEPGRDRIDFKHDFGFVAVDGHTITNPPEYQLKLHQGKEPLKLTLVVTQNKDLGWKTYVASSDSNVAVEIAQATVNPYINRPKWYEGLKLHMDLGVGDGVLGGFGASFQMQQFDIGPTIWGTTAGGGSTFYGLNLSWAPFKR